MELLAGEQYDVVTMVWLGRRYGKGVRVGNQLYRAPCELAVRSGYLVK